MSAERTFDPLAWLIGYFAMALGIIATLSVGFLFVIMVIAPIFYSAVLSVDLLGLAPLIVGSIVIVSISGWFCWRFLFPSYFRIIKRTGFFLQRMGSVKPSDTLTIVYDGLQTLWLDLSQLLRWLRVRK